MILIFFAAAVFLWLPAVFNAELSFGMQDIGISPENNFLIQGLLGMAWFIFPASIVVGTVLITQTERENRGILKMLSLPVNTVKLCLAKFTVLVSLAAVQILMTVGMYFISAAIASNMQGYNFMLSPIFVAKEAVLIFLFSIPMIALFWMLSVCIQTPVFAIGIGLASIVPSIIMINTKFWFVYPICYPFYAITAEYGKIAANMTTAGIDYPVILPIAIAVTAICLAVSCLRFGETERR